MWGSNSCWDLVVMGGFLIFPSEVGCITCFDYPTSLFSSKRTTLVSLGGDMQILNCKSRAFYYSSVEQMLFNPHLYHNQSADSWGSHNLFPIVTLVANLLFTNYISQHALMMPHSWISPWEGDSSGERESLIRPSVHLLTGRGGGWVEEMR